MIKRFNKLVTIIICVSILSVSGISCASKAKSPEVAKPVATVQQGNLTVSVSVDGNLVMPQAYDLLFGAPGDVKDVLVEEGDFVTEGTILARLDDTTQRLDVQSSNNNVQTVLSNLYEVVPLLPQFPEHNYDIIKDVPVDPKDLSKGTYDQIIDLGIKDSRTSYPYYYPNATALSAYIWAQDEVNSAYRLCQSDNYTAAASELYVALSDFDACIQILEDTINNPQSGLGNIAPFINQDETSLSVQLYHPFAAIYIRELHQLVDSIKQGQADIEKIQGLIAQEKYDEAAPLFEPLLGQVDDIGKVVIRNINVIETHNYGTIYGEDLCLSLYGAAEDSLNRAFIALGKYGLDSPEFNSNLRIAQHEMALCNGILGTNDYVLQHGLSLKAEQEYKLNLQNAIVGLENKKDDLLKTVILAPFDGTVVSVGVKKNDVLSAMDYSSKTAVQLVDTSQIKFTGQVDEIDILKIKTGQKAMISVDAVPNKTFTGTVSFISPFGTPDTNNVVKFPITIMLDPTDVALKGGLTATADIAISTVENALLVPLSAVTTTSEGSFVNVINKATGQPEKRQVTLGSQNLQFAEVLSGLKEGDKVIVQEKVTGAPIVTEFPRGPSGGGPPPGR
ncbi:MAG: efflux RND transporter periplasmic adaptor subunit [Chloroflexi bacterium]|nr:efflux RND transporter periplasmic adaptor subunit [Chloroflexota bacterium]